MKDDHFLRPALTRLLIQLLSRGDSLNICGDAGIGKTRLLEDIKNAELADASVVLVSLKGYWKSRAGFFRQVWNECGFYGKPPDDFSDIIDRLKRERNRVFLLIDDFHCLFDNAGIDPKYDQGLSCANEKRPFQILEQIDLGPMLPAGMRMGRSAFCGWFPIRMSPMCCRHWTWSVRDVFPRRAWK